MFNRFRKTLACTAIAAALIGVLAAPSQAAPASSQAAPTAKTAEEASWFDWFCHDLRACIRLAYPGPNQPPWYNLDGCGGHGIRDYYDIAVARGDNSFRVIYWDGTWDETAARTSRLLDKNKTIVQAWVWC